MSTAHLPHTMALGPQGPPLRALNNNHGDTIWGKADAIKDGITVTQKEDWSRLLTIPIYFIDQGRNLLQIVIKIDYHTTCSSIRALRHKKAGPY